MAQDGIVESSERVPMRVDQIEPQGIPRHEAKESQFQQHPDRFHFCLRGRGLWSDKLESEPKSFTSRMSCASPKPCEPGFVQELEWLDKPTCNALCNTVRTGRAFDKRCDGGAKKIEASSCTEGNRKQQACDRKTFPHRLANGPDEDGANNKQPNPNHRSPRTRHEHGAR